MPPDGATMEGAKPRKFKITCKGEEKMAYGSIGE